MLSKGIKNGLKDNIIFKDIKPNKSSLCPSSLPHLSLGENNVSQFIPRQESSYM